MHSTSSVRLSPTASPKTITFNTAAAPPYAHANATEGVRQQLFIDNINQAIGDDATLKAHDASHVLAHEELTALHRERDRVAPMCTDQAAALVLSEHLSEPVRRLVTGALQAAGFTVADYQAVPVASHVVGSDAALSNDLYDALRGNDGAVVSAAMRSLKQVCNGHPDRFVNLVLATDHKGRSGLQRALYAGHTGAVMAFMDGLKGAGLGAQHVADIVAARSPDGTSNLCWALIEGQGPIVNAFMALIEAHTAKGLMESLRGAGLGREQVADLLAAKDADGIPGLSFAMKFGSAGAVTAFMDGLVKIGLNSKQIADIVAARDANHAPGLYFAMYAGKAAVVTAFMDSLSKLGLSSKQIADIVAARGADDASGLYCALAEGRPAAVKAFMDGLQGAGLSKSHIINIVDVPLPGPSASHTGASKTARIEALEAYGLGLTWLQRQHLITPAQLARIEEPLGKHIAELRRHIQPTTVDAVSQ
ncbi:hypothetical protein [Caenimonas sp. SL110]|uniref:hypothetical protein n=1 Tax=Caenimonas sp. SL110 TaxID=1450524 RepID=UPI000654B085|nr:hypothetical protein [Caenimonas sp. SL110]